MSAWPRSSSSLLGWWVSLMVASLGVGPGDGGGGGH